MLNNQWYGSPMQQQYEARFPLLKNSSVGLAFADPLYRYKLKIAASTLKF